MDKKERLEKEIAALVVELERCFEKRRMTLDPVLEAKLKAVEDKLDADIKQKEQELAQLSDIPLDKNRSVLNLEEGLSSLDFDKPQSSMALTFRRTPRIAQGYVEPLLAVSDALPLQMVLVPGGTFLMGSPDDELERSKSEGPQHEVAVPSFFMGRYPVTQAQWRMAAALPQVNLDMPPDPSKFKGDNRPVERVSWYGAVEFCTRLSAHTCRPYRLPSEAEWEYACRAGTTTPFYFGKTLTTEVANYNGNATYADGPKGEYRKDTTPVDHFGIANAFCLCDMHGNVWEWCQDHWHDSYEGSPTDGSAWIEGGDLDLRILRGGSWDLSPRYCRSAFRDYPEPVNRDIGLGFRVVCSAPRVFHLPIG